MGRVSDALERPVGVDVFDPADGVVRRAMSDSRTVADRRVHPGDGIPASSAVVSGQARGKDALNNNHIRRQRPPVFDSPYAERLVRHTGTHPDKPDIRIVAGRLKLDLVEVRRRAVDAGFDVGRGPRGYGERNQRHQNLPVGGEQVGPRLPEPGDADPLVGRGGVLHDGLHPRDRRRDEGLLWTVVDGAAPVRECRCDDLRWNLLVS